MLPLTGCRVTLASPKMKKQMGQQKKSSNLSIGKLLDENLEFRCSGSAQAYVTTDMVAMVEKRFEEPAVPRAKPVWPCPHDRKRLVTPRWDLCTYDPQSYTLQNPPFGQYFPRLALPARPNPIPAVRVQRDGLPHPPLRILLTQCFLPTGPDNCASLHFTSPPARGYVETSEHSNLTTPESSQSYPRVHQLS